MNVNSALADPDEFAGVHELHEHARYVEVFYSISSWFWRDMVCYQADAHSSPLYLPWDASISPAGPFITALDAYIDAGGTLN